MIRKLPMFALATACALALATVGPDTEADEVQDAVSVAPLSNVDGRLVMGLISDGRPDSAVRYLEPIRAEHPNDPFPILLTVRAMRERIADEDINKDLIGKQTKPMHQLLDRAIELCDEALDHSPSDPIYRYYRGRAWLGKAQLNTLTRSYWHAGRAASHAKDDLEEFLELRPGDPDAQGDLGAFLYFADTLPGVLKFISRLLMIPGGDRERGLELLTYAASQDGVFTTDYRIALAAILLVFEGRFEEGAAAMGKLIEQKPYYFRLIEPFGVVSPLYPTKIKEFEQLETEHMARHLEERTQEVDRNLVGAIRYHRAFNNMYFSSPRRAYEELTDLLGNPPYRPDWVLPLVIINRGTLQAKRGESDKGAQAYKLVRESDQMTHFHEVSGKLLDDIDEATHYVDLADLDFIDNIYDRRLDEALVGLETFERKYGRDALYYFYKGEWSIMSGQLTDATAAFENALDVEAFGGDQTYQMFATLRLAEIQGQAGRYKEAKDLIDKSLGYIHAEYLLDMMMHARMKYYELLESGKITTGPTLLMENAEAAMPQLNPAGR